MIHIIQNDPRVPAGIYGRYLQQENVPHHTVRLHAGDSLSSPSDATAVIVLGGYMGVHDEADYPFLSLLRQFMRAAAEAGTPLLGICLGGQLLAHALGGKVRSRQRGEKGLCQVQLSAAGQNDPIFAGLPPGFAAFQWHNDSFDVPPLATHLASSTACSGQAFRYRNGWGVQFHPEVDREIIADWSTKVDPAGSYVAEFIGGEVAHRQMAVQMLKNFLRFASGKDHSFEVGDQELSGEGLT